MSNLSATPPFSAWGYGERHRCDFCGNPKSEPGSRISPQHKPDCKWKRGQNKKRRKAALRLLGITESDVQAILTKEEGQSIMTTTPAKFAVAVIVLRQNTEVEGGWETVLVARKDDNTRWSLPGGKVDPGETSPEAAHRELYEETGIHLGQTLNAFHKQEPLLERLIPQETVLDSGGYFTTFYLVDTTALDLPAHPSGVGDNEAPVEWGPIHRLLQGPYGRENAERFKKLGLLS